MSVYRHFCCAMNSRYKGMRNDFRRRDEPSYCPSERRGRPRRGKRPIACTGVIDWEQEVPDDNDNIGELGRYAFDAARKRRPMRTLPVRIGEVLSLEDGRIRQEGGSTFAEGVPNRLLE